MQYARLIVFLITIQLITASPYTIKHQARFKKDVQHPHQSKEFEHRYASNLIRRAVEQKPHPSLLGPQQPPNRHTILPLSEPSRSHSPVREAQSRIESPQPARRAGSTATQNSRSLVGHFESSSRQRASSPARNIRSDAESRQQSHQNVAPLVRYPASGLEGFQSLRQQDSSISEASQPVTAAAQERRLTSSLLIQHQPRGGQRNPVPAESLPSSSRQQPSRPSSPNLYTESESRRSSIRSYMGGKGTSPLNTGSSDGSIIKKLKNLLEKSDKKPASSIASKSPQTSISWPSFTLSGARDMAQKLASTDEQQSSGNIRSQDPTLSLPSSKPRGGSLPKSEARVNPNMGKLYRSNSDPLRSPLPPARVPWGLVPKSSKRVVKDPTQLNPNSKFFSAPASPQSPSSIELEPARSSVSSARSSIATSAFAQMAQGPPIVGAGLASTSLHAEPSLPPFNRHLPAPASYTGSTGTYEVISRDQRQAFNAGTSQGSVGFVSKIRSKLNTAAGFAKDNPGEARRLVGSSAGHILLGSAPAVAATGNVPLAASFGAVGAAFSYFSGGERIIPKIEKWQKERPKLESEPSSQLEN